MGKRHDRARQDAPEDVGTLWLMRHQDLTARCALLAWPGGWELRVLIDGDAMLSERCDRADEAFSLAEQWQRRLSDQAWRLVVPLASDRPLQRTPPPAR